MLLWWCAGRLVLLAGRAGGAAASLSSDLALSALLLNCGVVTRNRSILCKVGEISLGCFNVKTDINKQYI